MPEIPVFNHEAVLAAITPEEAIERVRHAFVEYASGDWTMPPKVYLDAYPAGDFRAMPAKGAGLAILKWITSFPGNAGTGLPAVMGVICVSSAENGQPLALVDARAITALRTGAVAAVAAQELGPEDARTVGIIGCGFNGAWSARCLAAAEFGPGVCFDVDAEAAGSLAGELGWEAGSREDALACDVVTCITPGEQAVVRAGDLHMRMHLNMLGADGPGKAEAEIDAVVQCRLFCDEWRQASHGGELTGAVAAGVVSREQVTDLGAVVTGAAAGRESPDEITLFDSTGLAIQDLALCVALLEAHRAGTVKAQTVRI
jgi:ornithine cyclodeaminase/alanine dehydrogenase-like protein (mu-crystallin family)